MMGIRIQERCKGNEVGEPTGSSKIKSRQMGWGLGFFKAWSPK
jgi:hypothetical protein